MTDGKNVGKWVPYLGKLVRVCSNTSDIILYGKLTKTNYESSEFLPYTSSRSTPLEDKLAYITDGDPRILKEDFIRDMEPVSENYIEKVIMEFAKLNTDKKLKREKEELSDRLQILRLEKQIKSLKKKNKKSK